MKYKSVANFATVSTFYKDDVQKDVQMIKFPTTISEYTDGKLCSVRE